MRSIENERDQILYLTFLKKEFEEMLFYSYSNQIQMIKKYKLEKDCHYNEKGKVNGTGR
ncbi:MAG: hypothetical protein IPL53_08485 [Ignavibacteria bacterium]|nr:hypothetical protein [Ignavibacteria bacterium]